MSAEQEVFTVVRGNLYFFIAVLSLKRYKRTANCTGIEKNTVKKPVVRLDFSAGFDQINGPDPVLRGPSAGRTGKPANLVL
jgi:hypothetical protein